MTQRAFAEALLNPDAAVPAGIVGPDGRTAPKRFSVYCNNVAASLTRALEASFPTVRKVVGDAFFGAMAGVFLRAHPPRSQMLMLYGADFPAFLQGFAPVAHLGYLPDVARLDQAMRESYHAGDSTPLPDAAFQPLLGEDLANLALTLAPSLRVVRSRWPLHTIWAANHANGPTPTPGPQDVVVLRPAFDPRPHLLPPGGARVLHNLMAGKTIGDSLQDAGQKVDLAAVLGLLIPGKAILGVVRRPG
jgi:Putative DNA-binding domain